MHTNLRIYYANYWAERWQQPVLAPIRASIPSWLRRYSSYGAILELIEPGSRVLDLGCGDGNVANLYRQRAATVIGVDVARSALQGAHARGLPVLQQDLNSCRLPLKATSFDTVILTDVLEHVLYPLDVLRECGSLLRDSGKLIISVPNFARLGNRLRMLAGDPIDLLHFSKYGDEMEHYHWYTYPKLTWLLRQVGFTTVRAVPIGLPFGCFSGWLGLHWMRQLLVETRKGA